MAPSNMCWGAMFDGCCRRGVPVRDIGEFERSEVAEEILCDARRCCVKADRVGSASGWAAGRPFPSVEFFFRGPCPVVLTRLRLLMTSVLRLMGRGRPCSFKNSPQALQSTEPDSSRRHSGVVLVVQFWQTGGELPCPPEVAGAEVA